MATTVTPNGLIPSLPDDVAVNILARVPRSEHPTLCLVSKAIRSLLSSPHFFDIRSLLRSTDHFLYLTVVTHAFAVRYWYALHHSPTNTRSLLLPSPPVPARGSSYAVLGHSIYVIGGSVDKTRSRNVWILDCRFHRWISGPAMSVGRECAFAGIIDGKIYVLGGCKMASDCEDWAEVLDPASGRWERVASPVDVRLEWIPGGAVVDSKLLVILPAGLRELREVIEDGVKKFYFMPGARCGGFTFDPQSGAWESVYDESLPLGCQGRTCLVDGVLYCGNIHVSLWSIQGFELKSGTWKVVKGLEESKNLPSFRCMSSLANVAGKLVMVLERDTGEENWRRDVVDIWCAEIDVEKDEDGELWGKVCWCHKVFSVSIWTWDSIHQCSAVAL